VKTDASELDIKKAYRKLAIITHPGRPPFPLPTTQHTASPDTRSNTPQIKTQAMTQPTKDFKQSAKPTKSSPTLTYENNTINMAKIKPCRPKGSPIRPSFLAPYSAAKHLST
jgi:hypothetical protein